MYMWFKIILFAFFWLATLIMHDYVEQITMKKSTHWLRVLFWCDFSLVDVIYIAYKIIIHDEKS